MSNNPLMSHMRQENVFVRLPSKGNFYKQRPDLTDDGEIGVRAMTSADEIALKVPDALFNGEATYRVLESCCPRIKDPREMPYNDVDVVLMAIRRATYGNDLQVPVKCKNKECNHEQEYIKEIDYIVPEGPDFNINTENVDMEIANIPGPQLVVPVTNARYSINAANARWGSLYDALYGTDVISEENGCEKGNGYNPKRGEKVIAFAKDFLDKYFPLSNGSHAEVTNYSVIDLSLIHI